MQRGFPICSLKSHLLSKPFISIQQVLSAGRLEKICRGFLVSQMNDLFKTIFQVNSTDTMCSVSWETRTTVQRLSTSLLQYHFLSKPIVLTHELCLLGDLNAYMEASICHQQMAISRTSFKYNSTDSRSSVSQVT